MYFAILFLYNSKIWGSVILSIFVTATKNPELINIGITICNIISSTVEL